MLKGRADAPGSEYIGPDQSGPNRTGLSDAPAIPPLDDLDYRVRGLLQTDSKMSEILVATDPKAQTVIFKIACVQQRARAETNRRAIHNSVTWMEELRGHTGIAQMQPIRRKDQRGFSAWFAPPTFVATLPTWPGNPEFHIMEYLAGGQLRAFTRIRDGDEDVIALDHAEVAVACFGRMNEIRRCACARKRRSDLASDVARFANTAHNDPAAAFEDQGYCSQETVVKTRDQRAHRVGFDRQYAAREFER